MRLNIFGKEIILSEYGKRKMEEALLDINGISPTFFSDCIKSGQEIQQEQCKDKTILEMLNANQ